MEDKVAAIYALREAAEKHAKLEAEIGDRPSANERDLLLDARIELEQKTQQAVETCVHCGRPHSDEDADCETSPPPGTVISVDFQRRKLNGTGSEEGGPEHSK